MRQFAWAASHDLQEPLRMVLAYSQLLHRRLGVEASEELRLCLDYIGTGARRLDTLLAGLREFIQTSEAGEEEVVPVDCNDAVLQATDNLQALIASSQAAVHAAVLPVVRGVNVLLVQVFQNLIANAIRYRSEAPPQITISACAEAGEWRFTIADNGIGIDPRHHERIFGVFRRLHGDNQPGSGMGLAICKAAVERLGGRIWVESIPGSGSSFYFTIPSD
jgi:light-regulated signal transduction histidine kinase (bacteriophytochrome)